MSDSKQQVNMSRHELLNWVNTMTKSNCKKIEDLCSGVAYCQIIELIYPNCINMKRVKNTAKLEHECLHNLKLIQEAFTRLKINKVLPIDRLLKGRFQDNLEFLQWFKKFVDTKAPDLENIKKGANIDTSIKSIKPRCFNKEEAKSSDEGLKTLTTEFARLETEIVSAMKVRDGHYEKLRQIELLLGEMSQKNENNAFCDRVFAVLYESMEDAEKRGLASDSNASDNSDTKGLKNEI